MGNSKGLLDMSLDEYKKMMAVNGKKSHNLSKPPAY